MNHHLAGRLRLVAACATVALLLARSSSGQDKPQGEPAREPDPVLVALLEAHNQERAKEKLPPLTASPLLEEAAKAHARDMAEHQMMAHEGTDGSSPQQRIVRAGYHYLNAGENVARGYGDVEHVMQGWMDSPPHKKNILGEFQEIGLARAFDKDGKPYWAADFGRPMPRLDPANAASDLIKALNVARVAEGASKLATDPALRKAAQDQAAKLTKQQGDAPTAVSFDGVDQRKYQSVALSTAVGQPTPDEVLKTLLASPDHKAQILGKFTRVGIGYATAEDGVPTWVVVLAIPAAR